MKKLFFAITAGVTFWLVSQFASQPQAPHPALSSQCQAADPSPGQAELADLKRQLAEAQQQYKRLNSRHTALKQTVAKLSASNPKPNPVSVRSSPQRRHRQRKSPEQLQQEEFYAVKSKDLIRYLKTMPLRQYRPYREYKAYKEGGFESAGSQKDCTEFPHTAACAGTWIHCKTDPHSPECYGTESHCQKFPKTPYCHGTKEYCIKHNRDKICTGTPVWCAKHPTNNLCAGSQPFCNEITNHNSCLGTKLYCEKIWDQNICVKDG